jgi:transcriptional regulator with XRE-family HTH domain
MVRHVERVQGGAALEAISPPRPQGGGEDQHDADLAVGNRVRLLRKARGRSLKEVAVRAGLSAGFLSQIERGLSSASVRALARIADALDAGIADIFPSDNGGDDVNRIVARVRDRRRIDMHQTGTIKELVTPFNQSPHLDIYIITLEPGGSSGADPYVHDGAEAGFVLDGGIELIVEGRKFILGEGDSFRFNSNRPHQFRNAGDRTARAVWVNFRDK